MTALLESLGWTDRQAVERLGVADLFAAGSKLYPEIHTQMRRHALLSGTKFGVRGQLWRTLTQFPRGLAFALPMIVSIAAMLTLRISLASYLYFDVRQATALALAIFLSFVGTGGFVQAIATVMHLLLGLRAVSLARSIVWKMMQWAMFGAVMVAVVVLVGDLFVPVLPLSLVVFMDLYMVLLSALWVSVAGLYVLRREQWLVVTTAISIGVVYFLWQRGLSVILAQAVGLVLGAVLAILLAAVFLWRMERQVKDQPLHVAPRLSHLAYLSWPYFFYGILYFVLIFLDRLVSWSTNGAFMPLYIWFRGAYELGMDWALVALIVPLAAVEVMTHYLLDWLQAAARRFRSEPREHLVRRLRLCYLRCFAAYGVAAILGLVVSRVTVMLAAQTPGLDQAVPTQGPEPLVFNVASIGYLMLAAALFNILLLFSLQHPGPVLRVIGLAMAADFATGMVLTRVTGQYELAVYGLLVGTAVLLVATTRSVLRVFASVDFYLYRLS